MPPNVLLVVLDSLRSKNTFVENYERPTTPHLANLAENSIVYTQARAPGGNSQPSHTSIFTGYHVEEHGIRDPDSKLSAGTTVWDSLADNGYSTGVFSSNVFLTQAPVGLRRAFDMVESGQSERLLFPDAANPTEYATHQTLDYVGFARAALSSGQPLRSVLNGLSLKLDRGGDNRLPALLSPQVIDGEFFVSEFLSWVDRQSGPWAGCINLMDTHLRYLPRDEYNHWSNDETKALMERIDDPVWGYHGDRPWTELNRLLDLYDGCIRQADAIVGSLLEQLDQRGALEETFLVITSDHGEGFGEHNRYRGGRARGHGPPCGPLEELLHVPLIVKYPGQAISGCVKKPATLTRFPHAVEQVVDGTYDYDDFAPDGPVLASVVGLTEMSRERASQQVDDVAPFETPARVVYHTVDGQVTKVVEFGDTYYTVERPGSKDPSVTEGAGRAVIEDAYADVREARVDDSTAAQFSDSVEQRLENLGYK